MRRSRSRSPLRDVGRSERARSRKIKGKERSRSRKHKHRESRSRRRTSRISSGARQGRSRSRRRTSQSRSRRNVTRRSLSERRSRSERREKRRRSRGPRDESTSRKCRRSPQRRPKGEHDARHAISERCCSHSSSSSTSRSNRHTESTPAIDPMAQLEAAALLAPREDPIESIDEAVVQASASSVEQGTNAEDSKMIPPQSAPQTAVRVERLRVPVLVARPPSSPSPSSSQERVRTRTKAENGEHRAQQAKKLEALREAQAHVGPLERFQLRSGEILESYNLRSQVLGHGSSHPRT